MFSLKSKSKSQSKLKTILVCDAEGCANDIYCAKYNANLILYFKPILLPNANAMQTKSYFANKSFIKCNRAFVPWEPFLCFFPVSAICFAFSSDLFGFERRLQLHHLVPTLEEDTRDSFRIWRDETIIIIFFDISRSYSLSFSSSDFASSHFASLPHQCRPICTKSFF